MPPRAGWTGRCLFTVFTNPRAGFRVAVKDGERVVLEKEDCPAAIILRPDESRYSTTEVDDWVNFSGIGWMPFYVLVEELCND